MTEVVVWSAWVGGACIGLYALAQVVLTGRALGVSSAYADVCSLARNQASRKNQSAQKNDPWRIWFILGIPLGGMIAALSSDGPWVLSFSLGTMYDAVLPSALGAKAAVLVAGGALMGFGARLAGGCTSGHAVWGISLLNWPSMVAGAGFFVGGIVAVQLLFRLS